MINTIQDTHLETFKNEYGETWWFDYDFSKDMGILWGNDNLVVGNIYYVFDGICPTLILTISETEWLKNIWKKYSVYKNNYLDKDTCCQSESFGTFLTHDYCPICLTQQSSFEGHHCIMSAKGGSDDKENILFICNSCHSLITNGNDSDSKPRYTSAIFHQMMHYGITFYQMNPENNRRGNKNQLYKNYPHIKECIDFYDTLNDGEKEAYNKKFIEISRYNYKFQRSKIINSNKTEYGQTV